MLIDKASTKRLILKLAAVSGKYQPFTESDRRCVQREAVEFCGDIPLDAGSEHNQYRLEFEMPRPAQTEVDRLLYTPRGMAWVEGTLYERYSLQEPAVKDLLTKPSATRCKLLPQGTVVQVETPYTYGDWVSEHLVCLSRAMPIASPLVMPSYMMDKFYVRRDLALLGIETVTVEQAVVIQKATVLHKTRHSHYWTASEAEAYRNAFGIKPVKPRPGSMLYLSRAGEHSEAQNRFYPSELVGDIMKELGATVVLARNTTYEEYHALGEEAETVVADHGAAMCNLLLWNTKNAIELISDRWWTSCFLFLAKALGISNYALVRVDNMERSELRRKIIDCLECFN